MNLQRRWVAALFSACVLATPASAASAQSGPSREQRIAERVDQLVAAIKADGRPTWRCPRRSS